MHRTLSRSLLLAAAATFIGLVGVSPAHAELSVAEAEKVAEQTFLELHNDARADPSAFGYDNPSVTVLGHAADISDVANAWSAKMAQESRLSHNPVFSDQICCWRLVGENVGRTSISSLDEQAVKAATARLLDAFLASDGHRNNALHERFDQVGIGVVIEGSGLWVTVNFRAASPRAPKSTDTIHAPKLATIDLRSLEHACPDGFASHDFADVSRYGREVGCLAAWDVTKGTSATTFDPRGQITRGQMASFIARSIVAVGGQLPEPGHVFDDVAGSTHRGAIEQLAAAGVVAGFGDGTFRADALVTRGQTAQFLMAAYEHLEGEPPSTTISEFFTDPGSTFRVALNQAADVGWVAGYGDGTYRPAEPVFRDHMAVMVVRWIDLVADERNFATP